MRCGVLCRYVEAMRPFLERHWATGEDFGLRQETIDEVAVHAGLRSSIDAALLRLDDPEAGLQRLRAAFAVDVDGIGLGEVVGGYGVAAGRAHGAGAARHRPARDACGRPGLRVDGRRDGALPGARGGPRGRDRRPPRTDREYGGARRRAPARRPRRPRRDRPRARSARRRAAAGGRLAGARRRAARAGRDVLRDRGRRGGARQRARDRRGRQRRDAARGRAPARRARHRRRARLRREPRDERVVVVDALRRRRARARACAREGRGDDAAARGGAARARRGRGILPREAATAMARENLDRLAARGRVA